MTWEGILHTPYIAPPHHMAAFDSRSEGLKPGPATLAYLSEVGLSVYSVFGSMAKMFPVL